MEPKDRLEQLLYDSACVHLHASQQLFRHCPLCDFSGGHLARLGIGLLLKTLIQHKTGASSRAELVAYANDHGLVER